MFLEFKEILLLYLYRSVSNTLTCSNGLWTTDYPSLVLGTSGTVNQGVLQMWNNATTSFLLEAGSNSNFEIYQKVSGVSTLLHALNDITANYTIGGINIPLLSDLTVSDSSEIDHTLTAGYNLSSTLITNSINPSKIAVGFPDQVLVSNHGSTASTWISMSGDVTMNTGVLTI